MVETDDLAGKSVGVEVSASGIRAVCVEAGGKLSPAETVPLSFATPVTEQVASFIESSHGKFGDFSRVGIAVPALVSGDRRTISYSTHIAEFSGLDLASAIERSHGLSASIRNDANAAAYAEWKIGAGRGCRNMFYATLGTGVGGAFVLNGELWLGDGGFAGEFGYVPVTEDGKRLEEVASTSNIIRRTRSRVKQDSTSSLGEIDESALTISDIVDAAKNGDDFSLMMLERTGGYVGTAIASVINLLNIERIIIGGPIMEAGELILDPILETARKRSFAPAFAATTIVPGQLGLDAAAAGAGLMTALN